VSVWPLLSVSSLAERLAVLVVTVLDRLDAILNCLLDLVVGLEFAVLHALGDVAKTVEIVDEGVEVVAGNLLDAGQNRSPSASSCLERLMFFSRNSSSLLEGTTLTWTLPVRHRSWRIP
jgi:hypothetical protein